METKLEKANITFEDSTRKKISKEKKHCRPAFNPKDLLNLVGKNLNCHFTVQTMLQLN